MQIRDEIYEEVMEKGEEFSLNLGFTDQNCE
jgi:hypothetical protein